MNDMPPRGKKKKGCLPGCLVVLCILVFLGMAGSLLFYRNRHKILPSAMRIFNVEATRILGTMGTPVKDGLPPEFLENTYEIQLPHEEVSLKVSATRTPPEETYDLLIEFFQEQGWEIDQEVQALEEAPDIVKSFSGRMPELRAAQLKMGNQELGLAVIQFNDETISAVWSVPDSDAR